MRFEIFSQGRAQEQVLDGVIRANDHESRLWQGVVNTQDLWPDSHKIIVATQDPIGAVLTAYTVEGHTSALSPSMFGTRLTEYCERARANWSRIREASPDARVLITENHTKPRHWAATMGFKTVPDAEYTTHNIANELELRNICELELASELKAYTDELAAL